MQLKLKQFNDILKRIDFFPKEIVKLGQIHRDFIARNCLKNPETHKNSSNNCNKLHIIEAIRSILDHPHMKYAFAC